MHRTLTFAVLALLAGGVAQASTLTTAPRTALQLHDMFCTVRNLSPSAPAQVRIEARRFSGAVDSTTTWTLAPGEAISHSAGPNAAYCAFVVVAGNRRFLRGAAVLNDPNDQWRYVAAIPAE